MCLSLSIGTKMEKVIALRIRIVRDLKRLEGGKRADSLTVADGVDSSSRAQMLWPEKYSFNRDQSRLFGRHSMILAARFVHATDKLKAP